ncbi:MFS transporter [Clostridium neuense]|uniref:MFS transporter n=1 Tax=Clostridium neuense TaxID=1728934 RepID=A0ABW8TAV8_9CLOT
MKKDKILKNGMLPVLMISLVLGIRQMAMTMVAPFISTYSKTLSFYTPMLAGIALGIFGLTQAIFQFPFGMLSDKFGNKIMMIIGLCEVIIGLFIAFLARNIYVLIFARALQGSGAIIGVGYSWASEVVNKEKRTKALSILGTFVSAAAALAFALGPLLHEFMSVNMMFLICAILLLINGIYIIFFLKDNRKINISNANVTTSESLKILFRNKSFIINNIAAFINNFMMMSVFYLVPVYLNNVTGEKGTWKVFLPAIFVAVIVMKIAVGFVEKGYNREVIIAAFLTAVVSICFYFKNNSYIFLLIGTTLYLSAYVTLATILATDVNNSVENSYRGTANGIFNSFQYIGNFVGPVVCGMFFSISQDLTWIIVIGVGILGLLVVSLNRASSKK